MLLCQPTNQRLAVSANGHCVEEQRRSRGPWSLYMWGPVTSPACGRLSYFSGNYRNVERIEVFINENNFIEKSRSKVNLNIKDLRVLRYKDFRSKKSKEVEDHRRSTPVFTDLIHIYIFDTKGGSIYQVEQLEILF